MEIYTQLTPLPLSKKTCVALGYFDGVHLGHRKVIEKAVADAEKFGHESAVFTFTLPQSLSLNRQLILEFDEKCARIQTLGIKHLIAPDFNLFCALTPQQFVDEILINIFDAKEVYCGSNFTFGTHKSGNSEMLTALCAKRGINVNIVPTALFDGEIVSSTRVRNCLKNGEVEKANQMLGEPYSIFKEVVHGKGLGGSLSVPTINQIYAENMLMPKGGVYATRTIINGKAYASATGISSRPTVNGQGITCETFIKNLSANLYEQSIRVEFLKYLAQTKRFNSLDELKACIIDAANESEKMFNLQ